MLLGFRCLPPYWPFHHQSCWHSPLTCWNWQGLGKSQTKGSRGARKRGRRRGRRGRMERRRRSGRRRRVFTIWRNKTSFQTWPWKEEPHAGAISNRTGWSAPSWCYGKGLLANRATANSTRKSDRLARILRPCPQWTGASQRIKRIDVLLLENKVLENSCPNNVPRGKNMESLKIQDGQVYQPFSMVPLYLGVGSFVRLAMLDASLIF